MDIKINQIDGSKIEAVFEVPAEEWAQHIKKTKTLAEASELLIKESWSRAVKERSLEPIGPAQTTIEEMVPGKTARFKVMAPVLPETKLPDYVSIIKAIKKEEIRVAESDVEEALKSWQLSQARFKTLNREAKKGDFVHIEFSSSLFGDQPAQQDRFILGEGRLIPGFEEKLNGLKAGEERSFRLNYPDPYFVPHLAGKEAEFKVKMVKVEEVEIDDLLMLAKKNKVAEGLDELKQKVRADLEVQAKRSSEQRWRQEAISKIAESTEVVLPGMLIDYEQLRLIESLRRQVKEQMQITFEEYLKRLNQKEEGLKQTYRHEAERNVKNFLVLRALIKAEQIDVTEGEINQEVEKVKLELDEKHQVDLNQLRAYTKDALVRDRLFKKLAALR